jgi:hypothetical protein
VANILRRLIRLIFNSLCSRMPLPSSNHTVLQSRAVESLLVGKEASYAGNATHGSSLEEDPWDALLTLNIYISTRAGFRVLSRCRWQYNGGFLTAFLRERIFKSPQIELGICSWSMNSVQMRK